MLRLLQFTLDLFDPASNAKAKAPAKRPLKKPPQNLPIGSSVSLFDFSEQRQISESSLNKSADQLDQPKPEPLSAVVYPANFRHPKANRESRLGHALVAYFFKRSKRRTIGFSVGPDGLVVSAPKWVPLYEVEAALKERADWIIKKLGETRALRDRLESARIEWRDGTLIPFLGEQVIVLLDPRHVFGAVGAELTAKVITQPGAFLNTDETNPTLAGMAHRVLHVALPHNAAPEQIRDAVQAWLMRQAKSIFIERLNHFAPKLGVQWAKLSLSSAGTRWGSASANGSIRLNWRLIHFKLSVIDYVVAHELSHLRVMDHSPRFWDTVREVVPDYALLRTQLKDDSVPRWH